MLDVVVRRAFFDFVPRQEKPALEVFAGRTPTLGICQWFHYEDHRLADAAAWLKRLGLGEKFFPVPWSMLDYSKEKGGYVVPVAQDVLSKAPTYRLEDLTKANGEFGKIRESSYDYFNVKRDW